MKRPHAVRARSASRKIVKYTDLNIFQPLNQDMSKFIDEVTQNLGVRPHNWQAVVIQEILNGNDVLVKAGTGSGKSLCYQALAFSKTKGKEGKATVLVIAPTIALMEDQVIPGRMLLLTLWTG